MTAWWLVLAAQAASPASGGAGGDAPLPTFRAVRGCEAATERGDITVCGARPDRHRLPLPRDGAAEPARTDAGTGAAALIPAGRCGIFVGERRCGKREALSYGYGGGRDPLSVLGRLASKAINPDH